MGGNRSPLFLFLLLFSVATGCSDRFDPFVESDQTFALYGLLDARQGTQFMRVQPITERAGDAGTVDARVTSTDLATSETIVWRDSLVQLDEGVPGTVFLADFQPFVGRVYRIEATRPADGATTTAEVRLPAEPTLRPEKPDVFNTLVSQLLTIESMGPPSALAVTYTVRPVDTEEPVRFEVAYDEQPVPSETGFGLIVNLSGDVGVILSSFEENTEVELLDLEMGYDLTNERPTPVIGGPGQIGVAARFMSGWRLAPEFVETLGLVDAQGAE